MALGYTWKKIINRKELLLIMIIIKEYSKGCKIINIIIYL